MLQRMFARLRGANDDEKGFTLIELLVVILIIGILAAIALPTFLGQQDKGKDSSAKSDARNLVSQVESCYATKEAYDSCDTEADVSPTGLDWGTAAGQVSVTAASATGYTIEAVSKAKTGAALNKFRIIKDATTGDITRTCDGTDGCNGGSW
ncbi:MAG TPA: prepilin-type N-terminal cleavage/methylation domain-containing protein [Solirubrobacteraceae bacterium]